MDSTVASITKYFRLMEERPQEFVGSEQGEIIKDPMILEIAMKERGRPLGVVYESPYHYLVVDLLKTPEGKYLFYERVMNAVQDPAVVIVPVLNGRFVLLHQYRHAMQGKQYAFPRGFGGPGLSAEENARKELREELGCEAKEVCCLGSVVADSGLCGNAVQVCAAIINTYETKLSYEGIAGAVWLDTDEMIQWITVGKIDDAFTISAFAKYYLSESME